jgi:L-fuconolactonase
MARVDAHHHLWDPGRRNYTWMDGPEFDLIRRPFTPDHYRAVAVDHGVVQSIVVQALCTVEETEELLSYAATDPVVSGVVGWVDLTSPDAGDVLARLREGPGGGTLVGIRHLVQDEPDWEWLLRPDVQRGLAAVAEAGLVYDLLVRPPQLPAAIETVARLPQLSFVLDHAGKPEIAAGTTEPWAEGLAALARHPNVTCKLSGLVTEAEWSSWTPADLRPYVDRIREAFGDDRLMFGSDWPVCLLAGSYSEVVSALADALGPVPEEVRAAVYAGTARRVYRLPAVDRPFDQALGPA